MWYADASLFYYTLFRVRGLLQNLFPPHLQLLVKLIKLCHDKKDYNDKGTWICAQALSGIFLDDEPQNQNIIEESQRIENLLIFFITNCVDLFFSNPYEDRNQLEKENRNLRKHFEEECDIILKVNEYNDTLRARMGRRFITKVFSARAFRAWRSCTTSQRNREAVLKLSEKFSSENKLLRKKVAELTSQVNGLQECLKLEKFRHQLGAAGQGVEILKIMDPEGKFLENTSVASILDEISSLRSEDEQILNSMDNEFHLRKRLIPASRAITYSSKNSETVETLANLFSHQKWL